MNKSEDFKPASEEKFTSGELDILARNKKFFSTDRKYINSMLDIIDGKSDISIRILDWFVANYSKKNNTCYKIKINGKEDFFYVHNEYKNQLNGYSKMYFDPFCRKKKVIYSYKANDGGKDINFLSSVGQLNFFRWAISNKVIKHVQLHIKEIYTDMKDTGKKNREKKLSAVADGDTNNQDEDNNNDSYHMSDNPDPEICSSETINSVCIIGSSKKSSNRKTDSDNKIRRQQLSKSVYDTGIKKTNIPIRLDFN